MDEHAQTSMNVHLGFIIVMPMQAVRIRLGVSHALVVPVIMEAEPAVQILMNVQRHHVTQIQVARILLEATHANVILVIVATEQFVM